MPAPRHRKHFLASLSLCALTIGALADGATSQVVAQHRGNQNPVTEGFVRSTQGAVSVGPITADMGFDAWQVKASGMARYQTGDLPGTVKADALALGWKVTLRARVESAPDSRGLVTCNLENLGGRRYDINVGLDAGGDTFVRLNTNIRTSPQLVGIGPTHVLTGSGNGYHLYELIFDPTTQTADLFVDGLERISDYAGHTKFVRPLGFYMGTYEDHSGYYSTARFEITSAAAVPLFDRNWSIACACLLIAGATALLQFPRRRPALSATTPPAQDPPNGHTS